MVLTPVVVEFRYFALARFRHSVALLPLAVSFGKPFAASVTNLSSNSFATTAGESRPAAPSSLPMD